MTRLELSAAVLVAISLFILAVSPRDGNAQAATIDTGDFYFCSASFESGVCTTPVGFIAGGSATVTWQVTSGIHTVTECDQSFTTCPPSGGFDSGLLSAGETFSQTFNELGTHDYYCSLHPTQMRGTVVVIQGDPPLATPTATAGAGSQTPVPTTGSAGASGTPSGPAQVPSGGGQTGHSLSWLALAIGMTLMAIGCAAGGCALVTVRSRPDGRAD